MAIAPGTHFGSYEITGSIGAGGMGEVYRATDTKLGREVAIKTLPSALAQDSDRLARFEREAKLLATLNHAHIGAIYGLDEHEGTQFIAMELVEGATLEEKLKDGPLPVDDALRLALQIAEALEAAHEKGVIHRDLKPANIMITHDGVVKVLDFGLAKAFSGDPNQASPAHSPALSMAMTQAGLILGTAGYMSPEQASGQATDQRADIWAFGVVLYEMLTGLPLFSGESVPHILADVLRTDPNWNRLPKNLHPRLKLLLERCLTKRVRDRYHSIADVRVDIEEVLKDPQGGAVAAATPQPAQPISRRILPLAATAVVTLLFAGLAAWSLRPISEPRPVNRFDYRLPEDQIFRSTGGTVMAVSPDGRQFVYNTQDGLYLRTMGEVEARLIPGTEPILASPVFSPDGRAVAYWDPARQLKRIAISGGAPVLIADGIEPPWGISWGGDGAILVGQREGVVRVPANGGAPALVIPAREGEQYYGPQVLPDGDSVLFSVAAGFGWDTSQIVVQSLSTGMRTVLVEGGNDARYVPTGHLVYALAAGLFAVAFDLDSLTVSGGAAPVVQGVMRATAAQTATANYGISDDGTLVYVNGSLAPQQRTLVWVDRAGRETPLNTPPRSYMYPSLSPDGTKVALDVRDQENDIWTWDLARKTLTRLTFNPGPDRIPVWSPDSRRIAFSSTRGGTQTAASLFWQAADGTGTAEQLAEGSTQILAPTSFLPDATALLVYGGAAGSGANDDIAIVQLQGEGRVMPLLQTAFAENNPTVTPDGRWLAYASDESGREEIYVRPFPDIDTGRWQVSTGGGSQPLWARSGTELFYRNGAALLSVPVQTDPSFAAGNPQVLFEGAYFPGQGARAYDVSADGEQFLMLKQLEGAAAATKIIIVENWFTELERLVPSK